MKAIILCGGFGTRLRPITYEMPKSMAPINKKPILHHLIEKLKKAGIEDIILSVGYLGYMIENYFGDGSGFGVNIKYVKEDEPMGTGGAVKLAKKYLNETFVYVNGDIYTDLDFSDIIKTHIKEGAKATMALYEVEDPSRFGIAVMDGGRIVTFIQKPKKEEAVSRLINAGVIVMSPDVLDLIKDKGDIDMMVYPELCRKKQMFGHIFSGCWYDLGTWESYTEALELVHCRDKK